MPWQREQPWTGEAQFPSLAFEADGDLHAVFIAKGELVHAVRGPSGTWTTTVVDDAELGARTELRLGPDGRPHVLHGGNNQIRHARQEDGGTWTTSEVRAGSTTGVSLSLSIDSAGGPHVAYLADDLFHATPDGNGGWTPQVAISTEVFGNVDLVVGANNATTLCWQGTNALRCGTAQAGASDWQANAMQVVGGIVAQQPRLTAGPDGELHVVFQTAMARSGELDLSINHAVLGSAPEIVEARVDKYVSSRPLVAVSAAGDVHLVYRLEPSPNVFALRHAHKPPGGNWLVETVDCAEAIADHQYGLAVDAQGVPWIAVTKRPDFDMILLHP